MKRLSFEQTQDIGRGVSPLTPGIFTPALVQEVDTERSEHRIFFIMPFYKFFLDIKQSVEALEDEYNEYRVHANEIMPLTSCLTGPHHTTIKCYYHHNNPITIAIRWGFGDMDAVYTGMRFCSDFKQTKPAACILRDSEFTWWKKVFPVNPGEDIWVRIVYWMTQWKGFLLWQTLFLKSCSDRRLWNNMIAPHPYFQLFEIDCVANSHSANLLFTCGELYRYLLNAKV